jgi:hypothetical protein
VGEDYKCSLERRGNEGSLGLRVIAATNALQVVTDADLSRRYVYLFKHQVETADDAG